MKKIKALIVAGGLPQITLIDELKKRNIHTVLVDGSEKAIARKYADTFYCAQIFDIEAVKDIAEKEQVDFLITVCADQVLLVVAQVAEMLGLPWYIDYETAKNVSDKELMKEVFVKNGVPTSRHMVMSELDTDKIKDLEYPLVVKPVDAYSSKGVRKVTNEDELKEAFVDAANISRNKNVIVEEFCEGEEYSVDVFVSGGKAHVLCVSNSEKVKDEGKFVIFRGKFPGNVGAEVMDIIRDTAQKIADAFGLVNSPMLIQLISDGKKISVLEFCARTGGAMKFLLIKRACGFDVINAVIDLTLGNEVKVELKEPENKYIVNNFIYCNRGEFSHIEGFDELMAEGIITDYRLLRAPGTLMFGNVNSSSDRIGGFTVQADSVEEFNRKLRTAVERMKIIDTDGNDIMRHDLFTDLSE
ncbi:MAG: ATP-grasp domain-containing protein [Eubacteriaceae bacterium]|nr:ATP-grasp domain-containing protein [Eubacteriaceae bacterium]